MFTRNKILYLFLFGALFPIIGFAAFDDVTLTTDVVINVGGINLNVSGSSAVVESITVDESSFSFTLLSGSSIQVTSPDRRVLSTNAASQYITTNTCNSSESVLKHSSSVSGSVAITVTPQSSTCASSATSAISGGGGPLPGTFDAPKGPFSIIVNNDVAVTKTKEVVLALQAGLNVKSMAISSHKADLSDAALADYKPSITWDLCSKLGGLVKFSESECKEGQYTVYVRFFTSHGQPSGTFSDAIEYRKDDKAISFETPPLGAGVLFPRTLSFGSTGEDVKLLQKLLNNHGIVVAESGVGSLGNESAYFGSLTEKAVQKFQIQYGIVSSGSPATTGYGLVGPRTRAKLNEIFGNTDTTQETSAQAETTTTIDMISVFSRTLRIGIAGEDVKKLQQYLNSDPDTRLADSGVGSQGNETTYFGPITENAVQRFQAKYGIVSSGNPQTTGYGLVGPLTRAKLNEFISQSQ